MKTYNKGLRNITVILTLLILSSCGGFTRGASEADGDSQGGVDLSGTINIPAPSSTGFGGLILMPTLTMDMRLKTSSITEIAAAGANVEILNSKYEVIATAIADETGHYTVNIDSTDLLLDTVNDDTGAIVTYYVRATITNADGNTVTVASLRTMPTTDVVAGLRVNLKTEETVEGDLLSEGDADNETTTMLLLAYGNNSDDGSTFNPLTADGTSAPPVLPDIVDAGRLVQALLDAAAATSETSLDTATLDGLLRILIEALAFLSANGALSDGTSAADAALLLFNADSDTDVATLAALVDRINNDLALESYLEEHLLLSSEAADALSDSIDALADSTEFDETALDETSAEIAMGALLIGHTSDEVRTMAATDDVMGVLARFVASFRSRVTAETSLGDLIDGAANLVSPTALLAASEDETLEAALLGVADQFFADPANFDGEEASILGAMMKAKADSSDFWTGLLDADGNTVDPEAAARIFSFAELANANDTLHLDGLDEEITDVDGFFGAIDLLNTDWAAMADADFANQMNLINQQFTRSLVPGNCDQLTFDLCGRVNRGVLDADGAISGRCSCMDNCTNLGNCCDDKVTTCGAQWSNMFLINRGVSGEKLSGSGTVVFDPSADSDGDGVVDGSDNCPMIHNSDQANSVGSGKGDACRTDTDHDGVPDDDDNCPLVYNPQQANRNLQNGVAVGDACNHDIDGDGICNGPSAFAGSIREAACSAGPDNCLFVPNTAQGDTDGDGIGDACDASDVDFDKIPDLTDNCPNKPNPNQSNLDGDSEGDACDPDIDGDGTLNAADPCPLVKGSLCAGSANISVGSANSSSVEICTDQTDNDGNGQIDCSDLACAKAAACFEANCSDGVSNDNDAAADCNDSDCSNAVNCNSSGGSSCGNNSCDAGENADTCPADCFVPDLCGNQTCDDGEDQSCPDDCQNNLVDTDGDGIVDSSDNCPDVANSGQADTDADQLGNACDQKTLSQVMGNYSNGACNSSISGDCPSNPIILSITTNAAGEMKIVVMASANLVISANGNYAPSGTLNLSAVYHSAPQKAGTCEVNASALAAWINPSLTLTCSTGLGSAGVTQTYDNYTRAANSSGQ